MENLELRMYSLALYQFSGSIHAGIQPYHATIRYGLKYGFDDENFLDWAKNWETVIILNGGPFDKMNENLKQLENNGVKFCEFREPDLGNIVTAISFIVDERVFNKEKYPDWNSNCSDYSESLIEYENFVTQIGGTQNVWLREFLKQFRLL